MKKIILILVLSLGSSLALFGKVKEGGWTTIAVDIANAGEKTDRGEFEAAKQAFLNLTLPANRERAATAINDTWKANFPEADKDTLLNLIPYPKMSSTGVLKSTIDLLKKDNIKDFLQAEKVNLDLTQAEEDLKKQLAGGAKLRT